MKKRDQEKQEEVKVIDSTGEESKPLEQDPNIILLSKGNEEPFSETEEERSKLYKSYKNASIRNNIIMFVTVAIFVGSFIAVTRGGVWQILGWVLIGTTLVGLVIYYALTRNTYPKLAKVYFGNFWKKSNEYIFDQPEFDNCQIDLSEKYDLSDLLADRAYKDITDIASRNIVRGKYNKKEFSFGEVALYKASNTKKRSRDVMFVGRRLFIDNKLEFEGRYIVNIKRNVNPMDLPTDVDDLVKLVDEDSFVIYGEGNRDYKKEIGEELISSLRSFVINSPLLNINIAFWQGKTICYMSYEDQIVAIPFQQAVDVKAYESEKEDVKNIFNILAK